MLLPALKQARDTAKSVMCRNNLKQLYLPFFNYSTSYDDYFMYTYKPATPDLGFNGPAEPVWWIHQIVSDLYGSRDRTGTIKHKIFYCPMNTAKPLNALYLNTDSPCAIYGYGYPGNGHEYSIGWGAPSVEGYNTSGFGDNTLYPPGFMERKRMRALKYPTKSIVFGDAKGAMLFYAQNDTDWLGDFHAEQSGNYVLADGHTENFHRIFLIANKSYVLPLGW